MVVRAYDGEDAAVLVGDDVAGLDHGVEGQGGLEVGGCEVTVRLVGLGGVYAVVKMVDFSRKPPSAIPEDAVSAAPPPQQRKAAPPGNLTREHRTDPR